MSPKEEVLADPELHDAMKRLERERRMKKRGVLAGLVVAAASLVAVTYLAYTKTPGSVSAGRIGVETMREIH